MSVRWRGHVHRDRRSRDLPADIRTPLGAKSITATYVGDTNFNASATSASVSHTVNKANTTATVSAGTLGTPTLIGQAYPVAFTVVATAPGSGTPTGNVTVTDGTDSCTGTVLAGTCNLTSSTAGTKSITATYTPGDANFNPSATSAGVSHSVKISSTTAIISSLTTATVVGEPYAVAYTVTPGGAGTPTGNVTVSDGLATCVATVAAGTCSLISTSPGTPKTVTATYAGDATFNGSTSTGVSHTVNKANTTTTITNSVALGTATSAGVAYAVTWATTVTSPGAATITGNVTVSDGTGATCSVAATVGTCNLTSTTAGAEDDHGHVRGRRESQREREHGRVAHRQRDSADDHGRRPQPFAVREQCTR